MNKGGPTKLGITLIVLTVAAILIGAVVWAGSGLLGTEQTQTKLSDAQQLLAHPTNKTSVRMEIRGPITAQENHYVIAATVAQNSRNITAWQGYNGRVVANQTFDNSPGAFADFVAVLQRQNFMNSQSSSLKTDGICANGQLLSFQIFDGEKKIGDLWSDSCGDTGTYAGNTAAIGIILDQIPNSRNTISDVKSKIGGGFSGVGNIFAL